MNLRNFIWPVVISLPLVWCLWVVFYPIFISIRSNERRSQCQWNQKMVAMALSQYAKDNMGHFPPVALNPSHGASPYGWADAITVYSREPLEFRCPESRWSYRGAEPWEAGYTDYFLNQRAVGAKVAAFKHPAWTVLLGDGNDGVDIADARYNRASLPASWRTDERSPSWRHQDGASYSFVDGHVKWFQARKAPGIQPAEDRHFTFVP